VTTAASLSGTRIRPREWPPAALVLIAAALVVALLDVVVVPVLLHEQATDWRAYEGAAEQLARGESPYVWTVDPDVRAVTDYPYIYPPPLAAIWGLGLTAPLLAVLKITSMATLVTFARLVSPRPPQTTVLAAGFALAIITLATPPVLHDLVLGNVMTLYVAGVALVLAFPRSAWVGIPIGVLVAVALKPAIAPFLLWMLLRRRPQFIAAFVAGLATTAIFAVALRPAVYVEYLVALPKLGGLAQPFTGNLGLASISLALAVVAIPISILAVVAAVRILDPWASAAVAVGMMFLAQPTLGLNYGGLLAPGVVALWFVDRRAAFAMAIASPILAVLSPPLAGIVLAATATWAGWRRRRGAEADVADAPAA
jgi:hypothetical protein